MSITRKVTLRDGTEYPSVRAFCRAHNLNYGSTISAMNRLGWSADRCINPKSDPNYRKHKLDYSTISRYSPEAREKMRIENYKRWIQRATKKHGNKFCYKNTLPNFKTAKKPDVAISCTKHSNTFYIGGICCQVAGAAPLPRHRPRVMTPIPLAKICDLPNPVHM